MAELLVSFTKPTRGENGDLYWPRTLGGVAEDGLWEGWIEFARTGDEEIVRTARETEQPNRTDLVYWAQGLSATYLEGALARALKPLEIKPLDRKTVKVHSAPRRLSPRSGVAIKTRVVLDPFLTYLEGEQLLRKQLHALSHDHLQSIVEAYEFIDAAEPDWARTATDDGLVERIVERVRAQLLR